MSNLLSQLTRSEQARLLAELNYMNLDEIRGFCSEHGIPFRIVAKYPDGKVKATKDTDRKPIVLARIRRYLETGDAGQPTRIPAKIVREERPPARLEPRDRLYYRWYAKEFERSEEHTSELQSRLHLVCRLLLEKKKKKTMN